MNRRSDIAIRVRGLSKSYTIAHNAGEKHVTLAETLLARARRPFARSPKETFWALKEIDFDIKKGDVVGIIGRNGAGKSTLLKILSRITEPTAGEIDLYGRVGSLLEVGTGFHPELTGRENIYLNGAILGMSKAEIKKQFDAIVDFAGVEQFLDTPVKRYSSGMYVRLAFAVAAHLESEILIVDEVLAVGDAEFQKKCLGKMRHVAESGRTVLFVSHQMQAVSTLCTSAICLRNGMVAFDGEVEDAIAYYVRSGIRAGAAADDRSRRVGSGELRCTLVHMDRDIYLSDDDLIVTIDLTGDGRPVGRYFLSLMVHNEAGMSILHLDSRLLHAEFIGTDSKIIQYVIESPRLARGDYSLNVYICSEAGLIDGFEGASRFSISPILPYAASAGHFVGGAIIYPRFTVVDLTAGIEFGKMKRDIGTCVP